MSDNNWRSFVLITTKLGDEKGLKKTILKMDHIMGAWVVYGIYDLVIKVETDSGKELTEVLSDIRSLEEIRTTVTMICQNEE